jgi:hypothetical protein
VPRALLMPYTLMHTGAQAPCVASLQPRALSCIPGDLGGGTLVRLRHNQVNPALGTGALRVLSG